MAELLYDRVYQYRIRAVCKTPLHIGSADGSKDGILVHPVDHKPFIQASGLAGAFRKYYTEIFGDPKLTEETFGGGGEKKTISAIRFTDAAFEKVEIELRPRLKIDGVTGTGSSKGTRGNSIKSGQKFEEACVAAGAIFSFRVHFFAKEERLDKKFQEFLGKTLKNPIYLGGQKTNGCGKIEFQEIRRKEFLLKKEDDLQAWMEEESLPDDQFADIKDKLAVSETSPSYAYEVTVWCRSEGELLVKGIAGDLSEDGSISTNIQNAAGKFIIPGSSWKGVLRSRVEAIARYLQAEQCAEEMFGTKNEKKGSKKKAGSSGKVYVEDTSVERNNGESCQTPVRTRIAIDKFTGGVRYGAMIQERLVFGELSLPIRISENPGADSQCGLLLLALRDLALGMVSIGSGSSVGRGFVKVEELCIKDKNQNQAVIRPEKNEIEDEKQIIKQCLAALKERGKEAG